MAECHGFVPYMQLCVCYDRMGCPEQAFFFIRKRWNRSRKIREYCMTRNISGKNMVWHKRKEKISLLYFPGRVQACGDPMHR